MTPDTWDSVAFYHRMMRLKKRLAHWQSVNEMYLLEILGEYP